jgi:hypothetical protein
MTKFSDKLAKSEQELPDAIKLSDLSIESLEVLNHFGIEAPDKLNKFCMSLEDAIIEQVGRNAALQERIQYLTKLLDDNDIAYDQQMN